VQLCDAKRSGAAGSPLVASGGAGIDIGAWLRGDRGRDGDDGRDGWGGGNRRDGDGWLVGLANEVGRVDVSPAAGVVSVGGSDQAGHRIGGQTGRGAPESAQADAQALARVSTPAEPALLSSREGRRVGDLSGCRAGADGHAPACTREGDSRASRSSLAPATGSPAYSSAAASRLSTCDFLRANSSSVSAPRS
jgi:hypothetical protein